VALIQSSALLGAMAGAVAVSAMGRYPRAVDQPPSWAKPDDPGIAAYNSYRNQIKQRVGWGMLAGLNVGLAAGIAMAYLPDQHVYGPSWQRVLMVDLAGLAGAVFATTIEMCSRHNIHCADDNNSMNSRTARFALAGAGLGLIGGWLLTMNFDHNHEGQSERPLLSAIPMPGVVPVESPTGAPELLPGLLAHGRF
jgi:MFS family permease